MLDVIPKPALVEFNPGNCLLTLRSPIDINTDAKATTATALLQRELGLITTCGSTSEADSETAIRFDLENALTADAYRVVVSPSAVTVFASSAPGWFYGVQTLIAAATKITDGWSVPCMTIDDAPRFGWRGLMLDVSRHVMPVDGILRLLDTMAAHKLNVFHWHLTDDQGWRVESKRFPKLTEIGAYRRGADGVLTVGGPGVTVDPAVRSGRYGGFYTHDDIRTVVAFAAERHITVVPEIEMPGHAMAALAAYPHLSCAGGTFEPSTLTGVFDDVYCAGNDATFEFLQGVLEEIFPLFPGDYVHVGGDECPKARWKTCPKCQARIADQHLEDEDGLQAYVIRRIGKFLADRGKRLIGWDEILEGPLPSGETVMCWRATDHAGTAVERGHDVVMTPKQFCYFDYRQAATGEPHAIGEAVITLEDVYAADPIPAGFSAEQATRVVGVQANVWTEYMPDMRHVEYMVWPRAAALAEVAWSPPATRDLADFRRRVRANEKRLARRGCNYRPIDRP